MKNKTRWKKRVFALAMTTALSVAGITAGPVVTVWAIPASGTAVSDNIVVRESAVSGAQVGGLSEGQAVSIEDETTGSDGNTWYQVSYTLDGEERSGWVRSDLLEISDESLDEDSDDGEADAGEGENVSLEFTTQDGSITLTDIPEDELSLVSDRFVETSLAFEEATVTALQLAEPDELVSDDAAIVDFYYVYGYNEIGETGWYLYNVDDGTIQKNILNMQYSVTETAEDETEEVSDFSADSLTKMAFSVLSVIGLLLLILTILFSVRYRRLRRILEEELEENEEPVQKKTAADSKRKSDSGEQDRAKTKKKSEQPEPVKVRKGAAQPVGDETGENRRTEGAKPDAKRTAGESAGMKRNAGEPDRAGKNPDIQQTEKASSVKKNKKKKAPVQEAPVSEPMSEFGGIDVLDLDFIDDTDFEALLNRYIEEDMASEMDGAAAESAGVRDGRPLPEPGTQESDMAMENRGREDIQTGKTVKREADAPKKTPMRDAVQQENCEAQGTPTKEDEPEPAQDAVQQETVTTRRSRAEEDSLAQDVVKKKTGAARKTSRVRKEEIAEEWLDDYDIPLEKGADYDIPDSDESDIIDLSKLKMPGRETEYYDDDDDLEFL